MNERGQNKFFVHLDSLTFIYDGDNRLKSPDQLASDLFGVPVDQVTAAQRQSAKNVLFPYTYSADRDPHSENARKFFLPTPKIEHQCFPKTDQLECPFPKPVSVVAVRDMLSSGQVVMKKTLYDKIMTQIHQLLDTERKGGG